MERLTERQLLLPLTRLGQSYLCLHIRGDGPTLTIPPIIPTIATAAVGAIVAIVADMGIR